MNLHQLTKTQLISQLTEAQNKNSELTEDIKAIAALVETFMAKNPLPTKVSVFWVITRIGAIVELIRDIVKVIKEKGYNG